MTTYPRVTGAIATLLILTACATTTGGAKPNSAASEAVAENPACQTETGSQIAGNAENCSAMSRTYSKDDIDRTGSTTAGEALRLLDPSVTVRH